MQPQQSQCDFNPAWKQAWFSRAKQFYWIFSLFIVFGVSCEGEKSWGDSPRDQSKDTIQTVRFVALGDQGTGTEDQYAVARAMEKFCAVQPCDFAILLGDNVYPRGVTSVSDPLWQKVFVEPYKNLDLVFYPILGNHDYSSGSDFSRGLIQVAYSAENSKWELPSTFYKLTKGDITFLAVDSQPLYYGIKNSIEDQATFFGDLLASDTSSWKIVLSHHPFWSNGDHGNAGNYGGIEGKGLAIRQFFLENLCGKVDLFMAGHDHNLQLLPGPDECPGTFIVSGGGGRKLYDLPGNNPNYFQAKAFGFTAVTATIKNLTVEFFNAEGTLMHGQSFEKVMP